MREKRWIEGLEVRERRIESERETKREREIQRDRDRELRIFLSMR